DANAPVQPAALLRCARALSDAGRTDDAAADARRAWITGLAEPAETAAFLHRWGEVPTPADDWARFQHLAWHDPAAAARQLARLDAPHRKTGEARLALQKDTPKAEALLAEVPPDLRDDPGLVLDHARSLRRADRLADAIALWTAQGTAAQSAAPDHAGSFWAERNLLARK